MRFPTTLRWFLWVLATGVVSWAWSEVGFWARFREGDEPVEWAITIVAYSAAVVALQVNWAPVLLAPLVALALLRMKMLSSVDSVAPRWSVPTGIQYRRLPWLAIIRGTVVIRATTNAHGLARWGW